jgi:hypothetical protein
MKPRIVEVRGFFVLQMNLCVGRDVIEMVFSSPLIIIITS